MQIPLALEGEGLADHHERLAAGLADGALFNRLALSFGGNALVGKFLIAGAFGGASHVVVGQRGVVQHVDRLATFSFLLQTTGDVALGSRATLSGLQLKSNDILYLDIINKYLEI